jgi:hypothetical protein
MRYSFLFASLVLATCATLASAETQITITTKNTGTVAIDPTYQNILGTMTPILSTVPASSSRVNINTGISNFTSYHVDYSSITGSKRCRFDASSSKSIATNQCSYTKAAQSMGNTYATCKATVTALSLDPANCSFSVTFDMK